MIPTKENSYNIDLDCNLAEELEREAYALSLKGRPLAAMINFEKVSRICLPCMEKTEGMVCKKKQAQQADVENTELSDPGNDSRV